MIWKARNILVHCWLKCKTGTATLENCLAASYTFKHAYYLIPGYLFLKKKSFWSYKNWGRNIYSSSFHNCQKLKTIQMSFKRWTDRQNTVIYSIEYYLAVTIWMDLRGFKWKKPNSRGSGSYDSIYMTFW